MFTGTRVNSIFASTVYWTTECTADVWIPEIAAAILREGGRLMDTSISRPEIRCVAFAAKQQCHMWFDGRPLNDDMDGVMPRSQDLPDYSTVVWGGVLTVCDRVIQEESLLTRDTTFLEMNNRLCV